LSAKDFHLDRQPIPEGFSIFEERLSVAGISYRKHDALAFCHASNPYLEFKHEPSNSHDQNAIQIWGCWDGFIWQKRRLIGYVPREVSKSVVNVGLEYLILPRLLKTYASDDDFVEVLFQIIGPKNKFKEYEMVR
jgi:hypothetical protein